MSYNRCFWAQSMDNIAPDQIENDGVLLDPANSAARQEIVYRVSQVTIRGKKIAAYPDISIFILGKEFVIKIIPSEYVDAKGRKVPVISYGRLPDRVTDEWVKSFAESLCKFTEKIERTISQNTLCAIKQASNHLISKQRLAWPRIQFQTALLVFILVEVTLILLWLFLACGVPHILVSLL